MAKLLGASPGDIRRPDVLKLRQRVVVDTTRGTVRLKAWPKRRGKVKSERQQAWVNHFICTAKALSAPDPKTLAAAQQWAHTMQVESAAPMKGSGWFYRDVLSVAAVGKLISYQGEVRVKTPCVSVYRPTAQTVPANTETKLIPTALEWDNNNFWNPTVNPTRLTFRSPGLYIVGAVVERTTGGTSRQLFYVRQNSGRNIAIQMVEPYTALAWGSLIGVAYFHANDYCELTSYLLTGSSTWKILSFWAVAITPEAIVP